MLTRVGKGIVFYRLRHRDFRETAAISGALELPLLPWCGMISMSLRSGNPRRREPCVMLFYRWYERLARGIYHQFCFGEHIHITGEQYAVQAVGTRLIDRKSQLRLFDYPRFARR